MILLRQGYGGQVRKPFLLIGRAFPLAITIFGAWRARREVGCPSPGPRAELDGASEALAKEDRTFLLNGPVRGPR